MPVRSLISPRNGRGPEVTANFGHNLRDRIEKFITRILLVFGFDEDHRTTSKCHENVLDPALCRDTTLNDGFGRVNDEELEFSDKTGEELFFSPVLVMTQT